MRDVVVIGAGMAGLAAAIKLTPAVAILVLLARREWRAAATMAGSAVGLTLLAALAAPAESWEFFTSAMWDPGRAGFADYSGNQNLKGAIARGLPESAWNLTWAACSSTRSRSGRSASRPACCTLGSTRTC